MTMHRDVPSGSARQREPDSTFGISTTAHTTAGDSFAIRTPAYRSATWDQTPETDCLMSPTSTRLTELVEELADTLTLSAYISTEYARLRGGTHAVWQTEVADFVTALRTRYANAVAKSEHGLLERNLRRLELRLRGLPHAVRASGWLVIVARGDVHYCAPLPSRGSSEGRWQYGPWLAPGAPTAITPHSRRFAPTGAELRPQPSEC